MMLALALLHAHAYQGVPSSMRLQHPPVRRAVTPVLANTDFDIGARINKIKDNINEGEAGTRGEAWVYGQFSLLAAILVAPIIPGVHQLTALIGLGSIAGGGLLAASAALDLGDALTPWPKPVAANELKTDGVYALCRHPIYGGLVGACFGLGLLSDSSERLLLAAALYVLLSLKAAREEVFLVEKHGAAYEKWAASVPALFPAPAAVLRQIRGDS